MQHQIPALAGEKDITGNWSLKDGNWTQQSGEMLKLTINLKQEGEILTGTISGPEITETPIQQGKVKDGKISFRAERKVRDQVWPIFYEGTIEGDSTRGTSRMKYGRAPLDFTAHKWEAKRL